MSIDACQSGLESEHPSVSSNAQLDAFGNMDVMLNCRSPDELNCTYSPYLPTGIISGNMQLQTASVGRRPIAPMACQTCRERHLKCNGRTPCSRCTLDGRKCTYVRPGREYRASQVQLRHGPASCDRPLRGTVTTPNYAASMTSGFVEAAGSGPLTALALPVDSYMALPAHHDAASNHAEFRAQQWRDSLSFFYSAPTLMSNSLPTNSSLGSQHLGPIPTSVYIDAYYRFFHHTHPILLPRREFEQRLSEGLVPYHLEAAIRFNGSFFIGDASARGHTIDDLLDERTLGNGYTVRSMLLFAIGMHAKNSPKESMNALRIASNLALQLGMNRKEFAADHGEGIPMLEESWRRTWWELYAVGGMLAGVCPIHNFDLYGIESEVPLPCEESEYSSGEIPYSHLLSDLGNAVFSSEDLKFSSFAYRIDAVRVLGKILEVQRTGPLDIAQVEEADAMLVNWSLQLPTSKREFTSRDGHIDEMLLQAHMVTKVCSIILHIPYSDLTIPTSSITACTPHLHSNSGEPGNRHTARTLRAAASISELVRHLPDIRNRSHFLACAVTLATLIHLGNWAGLGTDDKASKQSVRLEIGIMKQFAQVWPIARVVLTQIKNAASAIVEPGSKITQS